MRELRFDIPEGAGAWRLEWRIRPGDRVRAGDILAELITDKATQELEAFEACRVVDIRSDSRGFVLVIDD